MEYEVYLENLSISFKKEPILKGITHGFKKGKIHGIIGFNGSGKTVMLKCICGFLNPTAGKVIVANKEIGKEVDFPESLGMIIENPGFLLHKTGYENLKKLASLRKKITNQKVKESIKMVGLDPESKKKVGQYSLGMRERLGIAQAIMEEPELLILDEPFNGLDKNGASDICALLEELRSRNKTIILAYHNVGEIEAMCDTICEMEAGVLRQIKGI